MPKRYTCDLSHFSFDSGEIGHLQTLAIIPVVAGDSMAVDLEGVFRLSALRRNLIVDAHVDMFAFFVPHRHVYGDQWVDFIKAGKSETEDFPTVVTNDNSNFMGCRYGIGETIPLWPLAGYNQVWNRYFRSPNDEVRRRADDYQPQFGSEKDSGYICGFLPTPWSTGVPVGVDESERDVSVVADTFDIVDLNRVQAEYTTEVDREYFGERYNDLLNTVFGSTVNTDADERPTLLHHSEWWLSGYDVDGTGDATLGTYSGKSAGIGKLSMRRKFFTEHGALRLMCLLRFPTINVHERHNLLTRPNPDYLEIAGDPALVAAEPPADILQDQYFLSAGAGAQVLGVGPYGQWYRWHPPYVHTRYDTLDGFTFIDTEPTSFDTANYMSNNEYDEVFQTNQLGHWQAHSRININCKRVVPPARSSLYAGA